MSDIKTLQGLISPKFTKEILIDALCKKSNSKDVSIIEIILGKAKKVDSYHGIMTRFIVKYSYKNELGDCNETQISIITKALSKNIARIKTFRSADFFRNEIAFYEKVWAKLNDFQKSKGIKNIFNDIPLYLGGYCDGVDDFIILEDLCADGYGSCQRSECLDKETTIIIVKIFAQFHALSLAYKDQHPTEFEEIANCLEEIFFTEKTKSWYIKLHELFKVVIKDAVQKELPESYLQKLNEFFDKDTFGLLCKICATRGPLAVITHGDAWVPNFLMKYDLNSNIPKSAVMIDFQLVRCASLACDLHFFLYTCTDQKLRDEHYDEILEVYQKTLTSFLKELGSSENLLTLNKLKTDLKESGAFAVGMSMEPLIESLLDDDEIFDIDTLQGEEGVPMESVMNIIPLKTAAKRIRCAEFIKHCIDMQYI